MVLNSKNPIMTRTWIGAYCDSKFKQIRQIFLQLTSLLLHNFGIKSTSIPALKRDCSNMNFINNSDNSISQPKCATATFIKKIRI